MLRRASIFAAALLAPLCLRAAPLEIKTEHVVLNSGFALDCIQREITDDGRVRLYTAPDSYLEVAPSAIASITPGEAVIATGRAIGITGEAITTTTLTTTTAPQLTSIVATAGSHHNVDVDLLAAVIHAESGGNTHAVSRTGARGLMQLMPATATDLGVHDSFAPEDNVNGGTAYLDALLTRYHNNLPLALAAYNAGPAAVDRYRGIPPYAETRAYVARVIREFNRRKLHPTP